MDVVHVAQQSFRLHFDYYVIIPYNTLIVYQVPHVCHVAPGTTYIH